MEIRYHENYIKNSRGVQLFTCRWLPLKAPQALVFLCHGYGMECSVFMRECGVRLARAGYGVFGLDYQGHGKSKGQRCYIKKFSNIVEDCNNFFKSVCESEKYKNKPRFLYGESMGGAVVLLLHRKEPTFWNGAVLVAPMCKISDKIKPHPVVVNILTCLEVVIPTWKIVPTKDVINSAFKDPIKREEIRSNQLIYQDKPRLKTALEMLRTSMGLEERLCEVTKKKTFSFVLVTLQTNKILTGNGRMMNDEQVTLPFLVLHGEDDSVTDPSVSYALYNSARSVDKTIKLYSGMWHALTSGEPDHNIDRVFTDIIAWLNHRVGQYGSEIRLGRQTHQQEAEHDGGDEYGIKQSQFGDKSEGGPALLCPVDKSKSSPAKYLYSSL